MESVDWNNSEQTLAALANLVGIPCNHTNEQLSSLLQTLVPHEALAVLAGSCARSPMSTHGDAGITDRITSADLARLGGTIALGEPFSGEAVLIAGAERPVAAFVAGPTDPGALLVLVRSENTPLSPRTMALTQHVWEIFAAEIGARIDDADPGDLSASRAAAGARERLTAELTDVHAATLSSVLGTLRSRDLEDDDARRTAIDLAAAALVDLRASEELESGMAEERVERAFDAMRKELGPIARYGSIEIEFSAPADAGDEALATLPAPVAQAARAIVRRAALTMLEQGELHRIRVAWELDSDLVITVRDDGSGDLSGDALALQAIVDRAQALGGTAEIEGVPGWGTRIVARLPLRMAVEPPAQAHPLDVLAPRERAVLEQLARGRRNRQIAEDLSISENTVKFHVANVLAKLGVHSRGEAAALARETGIPGGPSLTAVS
jgi:DNA-binding CsgD family transcriptional regulator